MTKQTRINHLGNYYDYMFKKTNKQANKIMQTRLKIYLNMK